MRAFWQLYLANWREFLSNRRALALTIAFPVLFILIFGFVFSNQDKVDGQIGIVNLDEGDIGRQIVAALEATPGKAANAEKNPFSELRFRKGEAAPLRADLKAGRLDAVITIPAGLTPSAPARVVLTIDPSRQTLAPALQALLDHLLGGISASVTGQAPWLEVQTEAVQAREVRTIDYLLPGILAMSIMQLGLFATAQPLVALRVQGVLKRLGATPLRRPALLAAYIALRLSVALFQTAIIVVIGRYLFQVAMIGSWWQFAGWIFLGSVAFLSIGFFMAAVSRNEESCIAIGNIINLPMILLSGVFFPLGSLPRFLHVVVNLVPLNYLADALRQTMVDAVPLHDAQTNAIALGAWTVVMGLLAIRFFRWE
jgi:ABC-2 type transport system permease protein